MCIEKLIKVRIISPRKVLVLSIQEFGCQTSLKTSKILVLKIIVPIAFVSLELCSFPSKKKKKKKLL